MEKKESKNFLFIIVSILVVITVSLSMTFAFFMYSRTGDTTGNIKAGTIEMGYIETSPGIDLENSEPVSDDDALNSNDSYYEFDVVYNVDDTAEIIYGIYLDNVTSTLDEVVSGEYVSFDSSNIKVALENVTKSEIVVNPVTYESIESNEFIDGVGNLLYKTTVSGSDRDKYKLYMWIPVGVSDDALFGKTFSFIVNVKAIGNIAD